ncbi:MAG: excinuclease ABC subunit UvrA [Myxococcota bacterium]
MDRIVVKGAREHNLKNIDVEIPRDRLVVITGLSGSGKSSLAFDTIYAEGQRRYVESLSAYARQFLEQMGKPDIDSIEGLSPAISIEQRGTSKNPRSTVGTVTEIYDYLRLLFARVGRPHCCECEKPIQSQTVQQIVDRILEQPAGARFSVLAPIVRARKGEYKKELDKLRRDGFTRVAVDGEVHDLAEPIPLDKNKQHTIEVYVDRLAVKAGIERRLADSVELALRLADGIVKIALVEGDDLVFSERFACIDCGTSYPEITPRFFSFNNPSGACPECHGLGARIFFDPELVVPNPDLSLQQGAIAPWQGRSTVHYQQILEALAKHYALDLFAPWKSLPERVRTLLLHGEPGEAIDFFFEKDGRRHTYRREWEGVLPNLLRRLEELQRRVREEGGGAAKPDEDAFGQIYEQFSRYQSQAVCVACGGARLRREALHVSVGGQSIHAISRLAIKDACAFFDALALTKREQAIAERILREIRERLRFLADVGLDYLSLDRSAATLSGGEGQRIRLATQIGSSLVGVLYILDEPSIGLHQRDNQRLLSTLRRLRDMGNTVLVVEHDEETIRAADHVIDMGPGAGREGGRVVAEGTPAQILASPASLTGAFLSGRRSIPVPSVRRPVGNRAVTVRGARANNLKNVTARIPLGVRTCVTGVSGSGKSTLVIDTLLAALENRLNRSKQPVGAHDGIDGIGFLDKVIAIDQSPIGRTPRSNPATYTGLLTHVRDLFAQLPDAKVRGYKAGRFSFNVKGGRCEACQGDGILRIEMHFLPDVYVTCELCGGRRYNRETLEVRYKGKSIADLLEMTVLEACDVLGSVPKIAQKLDTLRDVGLGYLHLGQSATTLSGGEAQRIKLARELAKRATGRTLYILDEPTTGLHFADIQQLLAVLDALVDAGNTVVVIEHNLDVVKTSDWVLDLGPEGGDGGGRVVAEGTPEEVARTPGSYTGEYLRKVLGDVKPSKVHGRQPSARP